MACEQGGSTNGDNLPEQGLGFDSIHGKNSHSKNSCSWMVFIGDSSALNQELSDLSRDER